MAASDGDLTTQILAALENADSINSASAFPDKTSNEVKAALDRLASRFMVTYKTTDEEQAVLEPEAEDIVQHGSHEARVWKSLNEAVEGLTIGELEQKLDKATVKVGQGKAMKNKWISKAEGGRFVAATKDIKDDTQAQLDEIKRTKTYPDAAVLKDLKKRKLVTSKKVITYDVTKAEKYALKMVIEETDLTEAMIADGSWKTASFKPYNFNALGSVQNSGALHPLMKVRTEFRDIFFSMGFEEMDTSNFVETGFWNFDALFVQQNHPARDLQDTFYTSDPAKGDKPRAQFEGDKKDYEQYWQDIKTVHQDGKYGSIGYRYPYDEDESLRLVLRTHTTAVSTAMLYKLAGTKDASGRIPPSRLFSIDRVFRNETVDATHLAEFHQVEGVIADYDLSLGQLMEFMKDFFAAMGLHNLLFKPAFNPYTEPSMEIFSYHEGLGKLIEIGNSGMFRPEMLEPMGIGKS